MRRASAVSGVVTLAAGFGVMNAFYLAEAPTAARGLYSYWSATLGDALMLPVLAASLTEASARLRAAEPVSTWVPVVGALIGGTAGLATQVVWLSDPNPDPNWTIPHPHTFTIAG